MKSPFYALALSEITGVISTLPVYSFNTGAFLYLSGGAVGSIDKNSRDLSSFGGAVPNTDPDIMMMKKPPINIILKEVRP